MQDDFDIWNLKKAWDAYQSAKTDLERIEKQIRSQGLGEYFK